MGHYKLKFLCMCFLTGTATHHSAPHKVQSMKSLVSSVRDKASKLCTRITDLSSMEKKTVQKYEEHGTKIHTKISQIEESRKETVRDRSLLRYSAVLMLFRAGGVFFSNSRTNYSNNLTL